MSLFLQNALLIGLAMTLLWGVSLWRKDASIVDAFWGFGFVLLVGFTFFQIPEPSLRQTVVFAAVALWGMRLSIHLTRRNLQHGEDYRYQAMRTRGGDAFWWKSYFTIFLGQGALIWLISLPLVVGLDTIDFDVFDGMGLGLFVIGFAFEAIGDAQLRRFKQQPANAGRVLRTGLWRYTRHPNYFGDAVLWWGFFCFALPEQVWTLISPLVMTFFLMRVSGVRLLEKKLQTSKPAYADYMARTNAFFPWFPKKRPHADD